MPLRPREDEIVVKERVFISMIDYMALDRERWETASVRRKLERVLFIYYQWVPGVPLRDLRVTDVVYWEPPDEVMAMFESDWRAVQRLVHQGRADEVSERLGVGLVAATKGPGGPPARTQPHSDVLASQRAWALKPSFLRSVLEVHRSGTRRIFEVQTTMEDRALRSLMRCTGLRVAAVEQSIGLSASGAKNRAARTFQRFVAVRAAVTHRELLDAGVDLRIVQCDESLMPYESLSFPAFRYQELIREDWEQSELLSRLDRFLFVPIVGGKGLGALGDCVVHTPFVWAPSESELTGMSVEWTRFRDEIEAGKALELTPSSRTHYLHVRPKGRDGLDTDPAPGVGPVVKKCFWFNRAFVAAILRRHSKPEGLRGG